MTNIKLHKLMIGFFTLIFLVFNVGLPVILDYCKMMNNYSFGNCSMCHHNSQPNDNTSQVLKKINNECCLQIVLNELNKDDFTLNNLKTKNIFDSIRSVTIKQDIIYSILIPKTRSYTPIIIPICFIDLPTFNSTLLI